ncbi:hypothetical protein ACP4OV_017565 [Aristida adscensionis]
MASTTQHRRLVAILLAAALLLASPAATRGGGCGGSGGATLPAGRSYANCAALAQLGATLHWTYDATAASLALAFVASPPANGNGTGWVAWALNPTGTGMKGAQALLALKSGPSSAYVVNTYNLTGYSKLPATSTPIEFAATDLAADESGGEVRLYGKLQLRPGMDAVNHIWSVGSGVVAGAPLKHSFTPEYLNAKGKLVLSGGAAAPAPAPASGVSSSAENNSGGTAPPGGQPSSSSSSSAAAATFVSAPAIMLLALAGFCAVV